MPSEYVNKLAKENNMSTDEAEKLWNKAQKLAKKELDTDKEDDRFYAYTTGIFKKMMGVSESSLLSKFMKQNEDFSAFYKKIQEEEATTDSTSFYGKTPQGIIDVEEEEDDEEDNEYIKDISKDYRSDKDNSIKLSINQG